MKISDLHIDMSDEIEALLEDAPTTGAGDVAGIDKKFNKKKTKKSDDDDDCEETDMVKRKPSLKEALRGINEAPDWAVSRGAIAEYFGVKRIHEIHRSPNWPKVMSKLKIKPQGYFWLSGDIYIVQKGKPMVAITFDKKTNSFKKENGAIYIEV